MRGTPPRPRRPEDPPPDPQLQAEVRRILGFERSPTVPPPALADKLPEGLSDADPPPEPKVLKLPEPPAPAVERPADEKIPVVAEIARVSTADIPQLKWLMGRLIERFPTVAPEVWPGRLRLYTVDNAYLFVKTAHAALLATMARDPLSGSVFVVPLFCFHTDLSAEGSNIQDSQGERETVQLMREAARWGKRAGAAEVRDLGNHCDVTPGRLLAFLSIEKREQLVMVIR